MLCVTFGSGFDGSGLGAVRCVCVWEGGGGIVMYSVCCMFMVAEFT